MIKAHAVLFKQMEHEDNKIIVQYKGMNVYIENDYFHKSNISFKDKCSRDVPLKY